MRLLASSYTTVSSRSVAVLFAIAILAATLAPVGASTGGFGYMDKVLHALVFAILVVPRTHRFPERWIRYALMAASLGLIIEVIQPQFGRTAEYADFVADLFGIALGVLVALKLSRRRSEFAIRK